MDDALLGAELEDIEATAVMEQPEDSVGEASPAGGAAPDPAPADESGDAPAPEDAGHPAAADSAGLDSAGSDSAGSDSDGADPAAASTEEVTPEAPSDSSEAEAADRGPGPGADLTDDQLEERTLALLFASPDPLSVGRLVSLLERPPAARVRAAIEAIGHRLQTAGLPLQLRGIRGGYMVMTIPEMGEVVGRLARGPAIERISPAALETLSIVAYRQPVTKAEIEAIRGVQAGPILRSLVDRGLARVTGRADVPGHPLQYGTTKDFLDRFGLMGLDDLPRDAELARD